MSDPDIVHVTHLETWQQLATAADYLPGKNADPLSGNNWYFRGQDRVEFGLTTSIEREYSREDGPLENFERDALLAFIRMAPRHFPSHVVPGDHELAAWLGLIQHYGGATRLLDVTRSPYIALFFAFESPGSHDRVLWAIDGGWCAEHCVAAMVRNEGISNDIASWRVTHGQGHLVSELIQPGLSGHRKLESLRPFTGVFPLDPWKPDLRQVAQQALFLCCADLTQSLVANLPSARQREAAVRKLVLPYVLRSEILERLGQMNISAATLFPDLGGLARSLRTRRLRRQGGEYARAMGRREITRQRRSGHQRLEATYPCRSEPPCDVTGSRR